MPVKVMLPPPAVKSRDCVPFTVFEKMISPTWSNVPVFKIVDPVKVIGLSKEMSNPFVLMVPARFVEPLPVSVNPPSAEMITPPAIVRVPEWLMETGPLLPFAVVTFAFTAKFVPVKLTPEAVVVLTVPLKVVVPLPALCVRKPTAMGAVPAVVTLFACGIVIDTKG